MSFPPGGDCLLSSVNHLRYTYARAVLRILTTAIEMYRNMEMLFWLPETEAALAEVEGG